MAIPSAMPMGAVKEKKVAMSTVAFALNFAWSKKMSNKVCQTSVFFSQKKLVIFGFKIQTVVLIFKNKILF
jgi:hypothetical protein